MPRYVQTPEWRKAVRQSYRIGRSKRKRPSERRWKELTLAAIAADRQ